MEGIVGGLKYRLAVTAIARRYLSAAVIWLGSPRVRVPLVPPVPLLPEVPRNRGY